MAEKDEIEAIKKERDELKKKLDEVLPKIEKMAESVEKLEKKNREILDEKARAKKEAEKAALEAAKKGGDIEAIEKSWQEKLAQKEQQLNEYQNTIKEITATRTAMSLASELAMKGQEKGLLPHILNRIAVEIKDGKAVERVLDANGQPSALSIEDLKKEIQNAPHLAGLLSGSKASGGGDVGGKASGGGKVMTRDSFNKLDHSSRAQFLREGGKLED